MYSLLHSEKFHKQLEERKVEATENYLSGTSCWKMVNAIQVKSVFVIMLSSSYSSKQ